MSETKHLLVGGLVAMGFDESGKYLLTVSHAGRGVFVTETWEPIARDPEPAYPEMGKAIGIGPIEGQEILVLERDETKETIQMHSPNGLWHLLGESDGVTITKGGTGTNRG